MDDDEFRAGEAIKEQLDRELIAVGSTESARERLRLRLGEPASSTGLAVRWAVPLAAAAAVVAVVAVPAMLRDDHEQKPVVPAVSVPSVVPVPTGAPSPAPTPSRSRGVPTSAPSTSFPPPTSTFPPPTSTFATASPTPALTQARTTSHPTGTSGR